MKKLYIIETFYILRLYGHCLFSAFAQNRELAKRENLGNKLFEEFQNSSNEVLPRVWWHWMTGNVTKDGI